MATKLQEIVEIDTGVEDPEAKVVLFNDDFHTFQQVIIQVIKACDYSVQRAEQIAMLVHYKGKATVITSDYQTCSEVAAVLQEIDLLVEIEPVTANL